jgi:hypothetical protein
VVTTFNQIKAGLVLGTQRLVDKGIELARIQARITEAQFARSSGFSQSFTFLVTFSTSLLASWIAILLTFLVAGKLLEFIWLLIALYVFPIFGVFAFAVYSSRETKRIYRDTMGDIFRSLNELERAILIAYEETAKGP